MTCEDTGVRLSDARRVEGSGCVLWCLDQGVVSGGLVEAPALSAGGWGFNSRQSSGNLDIGSLEPALPDDGRYEVRAMTG